MSDTQDQRDPEIVAFGERVRARRLEAGLTQEGLAAAADLHWTYIGQIERGKRNLTYKNVLRIARGLQTTASDLLADL